MMMFRSLLLLLIFALSCATCLADSNRKLLAEIDSLCQCTGLQRKSDVLSNNGKLISVLVAVDGVTEKYWMRLTGDAPSEFGPDKYQVRYELPDVKDPKRRRFCIDRVKRLDKSRFSWAHFGKPDVVVDSPRGFRVRYDSLPPEKQKPGVLDIGANLYFLITPKGTVCSVWYGE
jgi:hypothetical protein